MRRRGSKQPVYYGRLTDCDPWIRGQSHSELSEEDVAPAKAFEAFMGKVYSTSPVATREELTDRE